MNDATKDQKSAVEWVDVLFGVRLNQYHAHAIGTRRGKKYTRDIHVGESERAKKKRKTCFASSLTFCCA